MSYAEHGPRIFLSSKLSNDISLIYGDSILPSICSESRLKLHYFSTNIRTWSPNALETSHYLRELNDHTALHTIPFNVIIESMIDFTSRATSELRKSRQELWKYKLLPLTREQKKYLENFNKAITNPQYESDGPVLDLKPSVTKMESAVKSFFQEKYELNINANKFVFLPYSDMYLSIYVHSNRFQLRNVYDFLLTNIYTSRENLFSSLSLENKPCLVSAVTSSDGFANIKDKQGCNKQSNICVEYVNAFVQVKDVYEVGIQTQIIEYENKDFDIYQRSYKKIINQKDLEIIILKNELQIKQDELQKLNKHLQLLLKKEYKNTDVLKNNLNSLQEKLKIMSDKHIDEMKDLTTKLSSSECLLNHLKAELDRKCQVCYFQSQEIKKLRSQIKESESFSIENEFLTVKMNDVVANLKYDIQAKNDKISQCKTQLTCMERRINNLTNELKSNLNNLNMSMIAYKILCECIQCKHNCLNMQSALSVLNEFIIELEKCKLGRYFLEINNLQMCMACDNSQETVSEVTSIDFAIKNKSIQSITETVSISSNCNDCHSSGKLVNVKLQSDDVDTIMTCCEQKVKLNEVSLSEKIDHVLTIHIKYFIHKMHKIPTILQDVANQHKQIIKKFAKQQQDLQKKDFEITSLKQKVAKHILQRNKSNCMIQKQLRKKVLKKRILETIINKRDIKINNHRENLVALKNKSFSYCEECDIMKIENPNLINKKSVLVKENDAQNEELTTQQDLTYKLIRQIEYLEQTINILKQETDNIDDMKKKLMDLQKRNNYLKNTFIQTETPAKKTKSFANLMYENENKIIWTQGNIKYDTIMIQKYKDIVKLQEENKSLRNQPRETEIKFARSNDTTLLQRSERNSIIMINFMLMDLSHLDRNKEELLAKINYLKTEIASCQSSTTNIKYKLRLLLHKNEILKIDTEIVKNSNNQLLYMPEDMSKRFLKDALYTLPGKIYEKFTCLQMEVKKTKTKKVCASKRYQKETPERENQIKQQQTNYQSEKYDNKLTLLKKNYNSLNAICKKHNESIEKLQASFEDIMKVEKNLLNVEIWLQKGSKVSVMTEETCKKEMSSKRFNIENMIAVRKMYSRDLKLRNKYRSFDDQKQIGTKNLGLFKSKRDRTLDWQREKFIYQCSIYHKSITNWL